MVIDGSGALYGTASAGGSVGGGVVFKMVGKKETVLHNFTGGKDGDEPASGLLPDAAGNLYGTDAYGGDTDCDCGVVFKLTGKHLSVLHSFKGPPDGADPIAGVMDPNGTYTERPGMGAPGQLGHGLRGNPGGQGERGVPVQTGAERLQPLRVGSRRAG